MQTKVEVVLGGYLHLGFLKVYERNKRVESGVNSLSDRRFLAPRSATVPGASISQQEASLESAQDAREDGLSKTTASFGLDSKVLTSDTENEVEQQMLFAHRGTSSKTESPSEFPLFESLNENGHEFHDNPIHFIMHLMHNNRDEPRALLLGLSFILRLSTESFSTFFGALSETSDASSGKKLNVSTPLLAQQPQRARIQRTESVARSNRSIPFLTRSPPENSCSEHVCMFSTDSQMETTHDTATNAATSKWMVVFGEVLQMLPVIEAFFVLYKPALEALRVWMRSCFPLITQQWQTEAYQESLLNLIGNKGSLVRSNDERTLADFFSQSSVDARLKPHSTASGVQVANNEHERYRHTLEHIIATDVANWIVDTSGRLGTDIKERLIGSSLIVLKKIFHSRDPLSCNSSRMHNFLLLVHGAIHASTSTLLKQLYDETIEQKDAICRMYFSWT